LGGGLIAGKLDIEEGKWGGVPEEHPKRGMWEVAWRVGFGRGVRMKRRGPNPDKGGERQRFMRNSPGYTRTKKGTGKKKKVEGFEIARAFRPPSKGCTQ